MRHMLLGRSLLKILVVKVFWPKWRPVFEPSFIICADMWDACPEVAADRTEGHWAVLAFNRRCRATHLVSIRQRLAHQFFPARQRIIANTNRIIEVSFDF